jgi:hypothetical protein
VSLLSRVAGKHRRASRHSARIPLRHVGVVDARTLTEHLLTDDAMAAGRRPQGRYLALCGVVVLPAALTVGERDHCRGCMAVAR